MHDGADEDFLTDGDYLALYYEGKLYCKATLDGVSIDTDAVLPAEDFALVPMGENPITLGEEHEDKTPPQSEPEPPAPPKSTEEDKTTEDEGGSSGSDYGIGDDTQPRVLVRTPVMPTATGDYPRGVFLPNGTTNAGIDLLNGQCLQNNSATSSTTYTNGMDYVARYDETTTVLEFVHHESDRRVILEDIIIAGQTDVGFPFVVVRKSGETVGRTGRVPVRTILLSGAGLYHPYPQRNPCQCPCEAV